MKNNHSIKIGLTTGIAILFIVLATTPLVIGYNVGTTLMSSNESTNENYIYDSFSIYDFPKYIVKERYPDLIYDQKNNFNTKKEAEEYSNNDYQKTLNESVIRKTIQPLDGPMDSPWPMYCHDVRHTGRSPYSTVDTWDEIWRFATSGWVDNSPAIDNDGTIYIGAYDLYAVSPKGTLKWEFDVKGSFSSSCPAIDENGIIYAGTKGADEKYLYAINPDGTMNWKYPVSGVRASPAIGNDGIIYFADTDNWYIKALYPNGTLRWQYKTNHVIYSSPAIGADGTVYCGSHDCNVYALYPDNGTLKWRFTTGSWVHGSPTVADDGTVYIGSDDGYLYALYPNNGSMKWKCNVGCIRASPALDEDGTLYVGVWEKAFYAIYPNGTIKWVFYPGAKIWGSSAALSKDGTLYFGTCDLEWTGGIEIVALYTDGTVKWRKGLDTVFSSPAIGSDGTVYIGSCGKPGEGYLNAFGIGELRADAHGPYYELINEPVQFTGSHWGGYSPHSYHWDFGDTQASEEQNPTHIYTVPGNYTVILTVTDNSSNQSTDTTWAWIQESNDPPDKPDVTGPTSGKAGTSYDYTFTTTDPDGSVIWYFIDWGDNTDTGWLGPYDSGTTIIRSHTWSAKGIYNIRCKAKDPYGAESEWGELEVTMPKSQQATYSLFLRFLGQFPLLEKLLFNDINFSLL
jgi:outer membrane protein assembly factor BamB